MSNPQDLVDVFPVRLSLEEGESGRIRIKGPFGHCAKPTSNGRLYKKPLMEREFKRLAEAMKKRRMFGELDHPQDGQTSLKRVSHIITELSIEEDGTVVGSLEPLPTPMGDILKALAKAGCELGVSSRGRGSIVTTDDGVDEVQDDFKLKTYDVVDNPASKNAFPSVVESEQVTTFLESIDEEHREDVRQAFESAAAKIDTFTLEDIHDDALRAQVAGALGLAESEESAELEEGAAQNLKAIAGFVMSVWTQLDPATKRKFYRAVLDGADAIADKVGVKASMLKPMIATMKGSLSEDDETDFVDPLAEENSRLKAELASNIETIRTEMRRDIETRVRAEMLADPDVAAAKNIVEQIAGIIRPLVPLLKPDEQVRRDNLALADMLKDRDFQLANVKMNAEEAHKAADAKFMEAHLKAKTAGHPKADAIIAMIGPVSRMEGVEELDQRLSAAFDAMGSPEDFVVDVDGAVQSAVDALESSHEAHIESISESYEEKISKLERAFAAASREMEAKAKALEDAADIAEQIESARSEAVDERNEAVSLAEDLSIKLYAAHKSMGRPDAIRLVRLCEDASSEAEVDRIIESAKAPALHEDVDSIRARVKRSASHRERDDISGKRKSFNNGMVLGEGLVDLEEALTLAGVSSNRQ